MNKINRSGRLLKTAFVILLGQKKLLLFPFLASGLALVIAIFFIAPIALYPSGHPYLSAAHWSVIGERIFHASSPSLHPTPAHDLSVDKAPAGSPGLTGFGQVISRYWWMTLLYAVAYFTSMFLATFCNVAFYHEIMQALNGKAVSIRRGFHFAKMRWRAVLMWSLFAGLVGYVIQAIEQRVGTWGRIISGFIGFAWSVACIFIIPTLVRDTETTNPLELLRHSAGTLKRTWGELVIGFVGFNVAAVFIIIPIVICICVIGAFSDHIVIIAPLVGFSAAFLMILPVSWLQNAVNSVYRCALFIYATEGVIPEPFDKDLLDSAWKVK